jgi:maltose/moltooligosaccharide transporter
MQQPRLSTAQIINMCVGFMGIQFGFALQNANVSRIFQTLGAEMDSLAILWIAAPLTGLLVQPIIGYFSDRTWGRFGRRRPYFVAGAILSAIALFVMPNAHYLWLAALMLWVLDASINTSMEPFRAYVGDNLPSEQRPLGFALQSFFIGVGAVIASSLPWLLSFFGVSNTAPEGEIPDTVIYAFYIGGVVFFTAIMWTVITSDEYDPETLASFNKAHDQQFLSHPPITVPTWSFGALVAGIILASTTLAMGFAKELWVMAGILAAPFVLFSLGRALQGRGNQGFVVGLSSDIQNMPITMRRLAVVQFFTWFALFAMWIYTTAAVTSFQFGTIDTTSTEYNDGANWVGILFSVYNGVGMIVALLLPVLASKVGTAKTHAISLTLGGLGLASFILIKEPMWLVVPMIGVGIAWAAILSLPYSLLSDALPSSKMGTYMGIFNLFIVIPQLIAASVLGLVLSQLFENNAVWALVVGGGSMVVAAALVVNIKSVHRG